MKLQTLAAAALAALALSLPATASAEGGFTPTNIGIEVLKADGNNVTARVHCVPPELAGKVVSLNVAPGVDASALTPGAAVGVTLDPSKKITGVQATPPCAFQPTPAPTGDDGPKPGPQGDRPQPQGGDRPQPQDGPKGGLVQQGGADDLPRFMPSFATRVWRFSGSADGFDNGQLSMTVEKILNLPKRFRKQDDELIDQDAIVLVSKSVKVFDADHKRTDGEALADADAVVVQGKLLPPAKWQKDEDGQPVTTIRAKRVAITG